MFKLKNGFSKAYKPAVFSCLLIALPQTVNAAGCDTGINILFKSFNEFVSFIPGISSAAAGLKVLGYAFQLNACNQSDHGYAIEQNVRKMLSEFKRELNTSMVNDRLLELDLNAATLSTNVKTARTHVELDANIRDVQYLEDTSASIGFESLQVTVNFATIKLSMLLTQYFLAVEENNTKEIQDIQIDIKSYMADTVRRLNTQQDDLETYLSSMIYNGPDFNGGGIQANRITGATASHPFLPNIAEILDGTGDGGYYGDIWVNEQKQKHRSKILTKEYLDAKHLFSQYATQNVSTLIPDDLQIWDPKNKTTTRITKGGDKGPVHIADFDGDGANDLFSVWGADGKWYLKSGGKGAWKPIQKANVDFEDLAFGDFDEDGKTDVFYADGSKWRVSYGGTSSWKVINSSGTKTRDLFIGDFDGDGKADVFFADGSKWQVSWTGKKSWKTINSSSTKTRDLLFGDFDNNGKLDVFHSSAGKWSVSYDAKSSWQQINLSSATVRDLTIGDFNGDGYADVLNAIGPTWHISYSGNSQWQTTKTNMKVKKDQLFIGDSDSDGIDEILWKAP